MLECRRLRAIGMEELTEIVLKQDRIKRQGKSVEIRNLIMYARNHLG